MLCTEADLALRAGGEDAFLALADRDGDGVADAALVTEAIAVAQGRVYAELADSHAGVDFEAPGPVPAVIRDAAARLALGWLEDLAPTLRNQERKPNTGFTGTALVLLDRISKAAGAALPDSPASPFAEGAAYVQAPAATWNDAATPPGTDPDRGDGGTFSGF